MAEEHDNWLAGIGVKVGDHPDAPRDTPSGAANSQPAGNVNTATPAAPGGNEGESLPAGAPKPESEAGGEHAGSGIDWTFSGEVPDIKLGSFGANSKVKGELKLEGEYSGQIVEKGTENPIKAGVTANQGMKGEIELGKQKAVSLFSGLKFEEVTEKLNIEGSKKRIRVSGSVEGTILVTKGISIVVGAEFKAVEVEWEKLKENPSEITVGGVEITGGVQTGSANIPLTDAHDLKLQVKIVVGGSLEPNWEKIFEEAVKQGVEKTIEKGGEAVLEEGVAFEFAITGALIAVAVGTVAATIYGIAQAADEAELNRQIDSCREAFKDGIRSGMAGKEPGAHPWAQAGGKMGANILNEAIQKVTKSCPDMLPDEARELAISKVYTPSTDKAVTGDPKIEELIGDSFWKKWVDNNHGLGTFLGDARRVCARCYNTGTYEVPEDYPKLTEWKNKTSLPSFMT
jgi:hypothetical protein